MVVQLCVNILKTIELVCKIHLDKSVFLKIVYFFILWPHLWHMGRVSGPGIKPHPQLWPMQQLWQCQILQPTAPGWGFNPPLCSDPSRCSWILNPLCYSGNSCFVFKDMYVWIFPAESSTHLCSERDPLTKVLNLNYEYGPWKIWVPVQQGDDSVVLNLDSFPRECVVFCSSVGEKENSTRFGPEWPQFKVRIWYLGRKT